MQRASVAACLVGACLVVAPSRAARADEPVAVIAHAASGMSEISLTALRRVYLGVITELGGKRVHRYHLRSGSPAREAFSITALGRPELELHEYWIEQALTGGRIPPRELPDPARLIEELTRRKGALGYVPLGALEALDSDARRRLRVLRLLDGTSSWSVSDPDYPLRISEAEKGKDPP
jgi:hypothetical protein